MRARYQAARIPDLIGFRSAELGSAGAGPRSTYPSDCYLRVTPTLSRAVRAGPATGASAVLSRSRPRRNAGGSDSAEAPARGVHEPGMIVTPARPTPARSQAEFPERILDGFPTVRRALERRGVVLARAEREGPETHADRLGTELMALFRDTQGQRAYEALYALTSTSVLAWIRRMVRTLGCAVDPTELLQDTFVNVYRYSARFRSDHVGSFRVWVRTIGANVVKRAGGRRSQVSLSALPEGCQEPADDRTGPAGIAMAHEEVGELRGTWSLLLACYLSAWAELSERDRQALHLVDVRGQSYAEASAILQVGPSNMKMIMFRARRRLLAHLRRRLSVREPVGAAA